MFKFEYWDEEHKIYNSMELREDDLRHDEVVERFTDFLRGCSYVFDHLAMYRLVDNEGEVMPSFEEKLRKLQDQYDEEDQYTFPVI